jgi:hypothetical protein
MPELINPEIIVELIVKLVETPYSLKTNNESFSVLKRSTSHSGLKLSFRFLPYRNRTYLNFEALKKSLTILSNPS